VAKLFVDAGLIVITAFISPFKHERQTVRELVKKGEFFEVYMNTPLTTCEERDSKGLYKKARAGDIKEFTGIDSHYESPINPEITLDTSVMNEEQCVHRVLQHLQRAGKLPELTQ
jgi:adenylylsulfate kinase